jgi:hypothetical protein
LRILPETAMIQTSRPQSEDSIDETKAVKIIDLAID